MNKNTLDFNTDMIYNFVQQFAEIMSDKISEKLYAKMKSSNGSNFDNSTNKICLPETEAITIDELCDVLKISKPTAYKLISQKDFPSFHIGNSIRISRSKLNEWIFDRCTEEGA